MQPDTVFYHARVLTMADCPAQAEALALRGGRVMAVGSNRKVLSLAGPQTKCYDLGGRTILPGFTDAHVHLVAYGLSLMRQADLTGCTSLEELLDHLRQHQREGRLAGGVWLLGRGFDQERLRERRFPTRTDLDRAFPSTPVLLTRICGHACVANSRALELAGVDSEDGLLREGQTAPLWAAVPPPTLEEAQEGARRAVQEALAAGLTAAHVLVDSAVQVRTVLSLRAAGEWPLRTLLLLPFGWLEALQKLGLTAGFGDEFVRLGPLKVFADGSLGARTAALEEDYSDAPGERGQLLHDLEELRALAREAAAAGFSVAVHAIGDRANRVAIEALRALEAPAGPFPLRLEHASLLSEELVNRLAEANLLLVVQPQFIKSDFWTRQRVGPVRFRWAYPLKTLLQQGVRLAGGSDCPVERLSPLEGISRAVTRDGQMPEENLTVEEALRLFTVGGAEAEGAEEWRGRLGPGYVADFVVLAADPRQVPPERLPELSVESVWIAGQEWWAAP
ncbi:MAG TPA: amidohydrolase [Armatimonadetes bacterium]|nr:amidohydrolase [Armatimonadota bacterium]